VEKNEDLVTYLIQPYAFTGTSQTVVSEDAYGVMASYTVALAVSEICARYRTKL